VLATFHCVCLAWCFFRLTALADSLACVGKCANFDVDRAWVGGVAEPSLWLALAGYAGLWWVLGRAELLAGRAAAVSPGLGWLALGFRWGCRVALLLLAVLLSPGGVAQPFIYFQF
jgi:hypothetical protein